jgi:hypothetical protein
MEIIIGIIIVVGIAVVLINRKPKSTVTVVESAPYKVDVPSVAEEATKAVVESIAPAKKPRATKAPAAKKVAAKKVAAKKTATKKPKAK